MSRCQGAQVLCKRESSLYKTYGTSSLKISVESCLEPRNPKNVNADLKHLRMNLIMSLNLYIHLESLVQKKKHAPKCHRFGRLPVLDIVHCSLELLNFFYIPFSIAWYNFFFLTNTKMAKKDLIASFHLYYDLRFAASKREVIDTSQYVCMVKRTQRAKKKCLFSRVNWSKLNDLSARTKRGHSWTMSDVILLVL